MTRADPEVGSITARRIAQAICVCVCVRCGTTDKVDSQVRICVVEAP